MGQQQRRRSGTVAQVALVSAVVAVLVGTAGAAVASGSRRTNGFEVRSLDGLGNNRAHVTWGEGPSYRGPGNTWFTSGL